MPGATGARPMGITIIAILALITGAFGILAVIGLGGIDAAVGASVGGTTTIYGILLLVLSVAQIALAYAFWTLKAWGWRLGVILAFVSVIWAIAGLALYRFDLTNLIISVVVSAVWIYYLNLPAIRTAFGAPASGLPLVGNALDPILGKIKI